MKAGLGTKIFTSEERKVPTFGIKRRSFTPEPRLYLRTPPLLLAPKGKMLVGRKQTSLFFLRLSEIGENSPFD